jgi:hypothetical protein
MTSITDHTSCKLRHRSDQISEERYWMSVCGAEGTLRYSNAMPNANATVHRFWGNIGGPHCVNQQFEFLRTLIKENTREATDPNQLNALLMCRLPWSVGTEHNDRRWAMTPINRGGHDSQLAR